MRLEWIAQPEMLPRGFAGGLLVHDGALVDMDRLVTRLLQHPRIVVKQNVEITRLESREGKMYTLGREHTLAAKCVVLSANAYIGMLSPYLAESVEWRAVPCLCRTHCAMALPQNMPCPRSSTAAK